MLYELLLECINIPYSTVGISTNYAVRRDGSHLYIFFQGSVELSDWHINADFPAKACSREGDRSYFAHRGFVDAWSGILPVLSPLILDRGVRSLTVCGYSHGAALALLCHEYVWFVRPDLRASLQGFGFGCPRVYWGIRRDDLLSRWQNFTVVRNIDDVVTHLPPAVLGYSHVGNMLEVGEDGRYTSLEAHRADNMLAEVRKYERAQSKIINKTAST